MSCTPAGVPPMARPTRTPASYPASTAESSSVPVGTRVLGEGEHGGDDVGRGVSAREPVPVLQLVGGQGRRVEQHGGHRGPAPRGPKNGGVTDGGERGVHLGEPPQLHPCGAQRRDGDAVGDEVDDLVAHVRRGVEPVGPGHRGGEPVEVGVVRRRGRHRAPPTRVLRLARSERRGRSSHQRSRASAPVSGSPRRRSATCLARITSGG